MYILSRIQILSHVLLLCAHCTSTLTTVSGHNTDTVLLMLYYYTLTYCQYFTLINDTFSVLQTVLLYNSSNWLSWQKKTPFNGVVFSNFMTFRSTEWPLYGSIQHFWLIYVTRLYTNITVFHAYSSRIYCDYHRCCCDYYCYYYYLLPHILMHLVR